MMNPMRRTWTELTRQRGSNPRARRSGVALLVVISTLMVLTVLITEVAYGAQVRFVVGSHQRDRVQATWLARSGVNLYRLILAANKELESNATLSSYAEMAGVNLGDALWQMIPVLNTGLIRMLLGSGGSIDDVEEADMQTFLSTGEVDEGAVEESREGGLFSDRNFLDFDGDFTAEVTDHEGRVNVNMFAKKDASSTLQDSTTAQVLYAIMSGEDNDQWFHERNIDRWEVIGNLKDWVDTDSYRSGGLGGLEDSLYNRGDNPYLCKNAPFDTIDEIRLVEGWQDELFDKFGRDITIYGKSTKINVNTADDAVLYGIIRQCSSGRQPSVSELEVCFENPVVMMFRDTWSKSDEFAETLLTNCGIETDSACLKTSVTTSSQTFTIKSTGLVGTSEVTITTVLDFNTNTSGQMVYWRVD